jgi:hypothetical protein
VPPVALFPRVYLRKALEEQYLKKHFQKKVIRTVLLEYWRLAARKYLSSLEEHNSFYGWILSTNFGQAGPEREAIRLWEIHDDGCSGPESTWSIHTLSSATY